MRNNPNSAVHRVRFHAKISRGVQKERTRSHIRKTPTEGNGALNKVEDAGSNEPVKEAYVYARRGSGADVPENVCRYG